ncbi:MAG: hypothetical protein DRJ67_07175 [Thermoprotei archaeon]|nr:MAG: hypothetical protein DRJ67_07175 [Thermoprotei archaeon]
MVEEKGRTSLACLAKALEADIIVVLVPETLLCPGERPREEHAMRYEELGKCVRGLLRLAENGCREDREAWEAYRRALERLRGIMSELCREWLGDVSERIEVAVVPAIGEYAGPKGVRVLWRLGPSKIDPVTTYAAYSMMTAVAAISALNVETSERLRMILDTTHGINYMPLAAYRALMAASRLISAALNVTVEFEQYNSAPYPRGVPQPPVLDIYMVRNEVITPTKAAQRLVYSYLIRDAGKAEPFHRMRDCLPTTHAELNSLRKKFNECIELHSKAEVLAAAIHFSMPLALLQFSSEFERPELSRLARGIRSILDNLMSYVKMKGDGRDKLVVTHLALPHYDDLKSLLAAASLVEYGINALEASKVTKSDDRIEADLSTLKQVVGEWLSGPLQRVAEHELACFENAFKTGEIPAKDLLSLIERAKKSPGEWVNVDGKCEDQDRIMVAHAGLALRAIEVRAQEELYIRYREECLDGVKKLLRGALKPLRQLLMIRAT